MSAFNTWNMRLEMEKRKRQQQVDPQAFHNAAMQATAQQASARYNAPAMRPAQQASNASINQVSYTRPMPKQPSPVPQRPVGMGTSPLPAQQPMQQAAPTYDPMARLELSRRLNQTKRDRVAAAQGGQDITDYRNAEHEMRMQLAAMNRLRNAEGAAQAEARDPGGIERARMLDKQLPGAMLAGNASASEAALRQLALRQRYNLPTDEPMQRLMDLSMEPIAPANPNYFADRAAPRDTDKMRRDARMQLTQTMNRATPGMDALDQRAEFLRQTEQLDQRLAMAAQQRAIEDVSGESRYDAAYAQALGLDAGTPLTPEMRALGQRAMQRQVAGASIEPQDAMIGAGVVKSGTNVIGGANSSADLDAMERAMNQYDATTDPVVREALRQQIISAMTNAGMTLDDFGPQRPNVVREGIMNAPNMFIGWQSPRQFLDNWATIFGKPTSDDRRQRAATLIGRLQRLFFPETPQGTP